jgi:7,8-dihydroneopterin aldolase/epimerase/oxygenase
MRVGARPNRRSGFSDPSLLLWRRRCSVKGACLSDLLQLQVHDLEVEVLTGVYSEETHLPQPLRISVTADIDMPERFLPDTPLGASKSYLDLKHAATTGLPKDVHFTLIEAVAEHICDTLFISDARVRRVEVRIVKLAIAEHGESIGVTMVRHRR